MKLYLNNNGDPKSHVNGQKIVAALLCFTCVIIYGIFTATNRNGFNAIFGVAANKEKNNSTGSTGKLLFKSISN